MKTVTLSAKQLLVLKLFAVGWTTRQIGGEMGISHKTVEWHRARIAAQLGTTSLAVFGFFAAVFHLVHPYEMRKKFRLVKI